MINGLETYKQRWNIHTDSDIKPGLEAITAALSQLNNPHRTGKFVHIAGTNGKGSTAAMLAGILREHGMTVGNFFSPGIDDLHDQIQINGQAVSTEDLDSAMDRLSKLQTPLTDFELLTAAAFVIFEQHSPDITIIEAGMGGRFDSTNVIDPVISIIPSISLEHTNFLGETIEKIAWHKAGVIKKWKPVIVGQVPDAAMKVIEETADGLHAEIISPGSSLDLELRLKGRHQQKNALLALEAAKEILQFDFINDKAEQGLADAAIPFRFEEVYPNVIFDGAHNEASIDALIDTVRSVYPDKEIRIVMGILQDKDYITILRKLEGISDHFCFVDFENKRAISSEKLFEESRSKIKTIANKRDILPVTEKNEVIIVTGSLYLLSNLRSENSRLFDNFLSK